MSCVVVVFVSVDGRNSKSAAVVFRSLQTSSPHQPTLAAAAALAAAHAVVVVELHAWLRVEWQWARPGRRPASSPSWLWRPVAA